MPINQTAAVEARTAGPADLETASVCSADDFEMLRSAVKAFAHLMTGPNKTMLHKLVFLLDLEYFRENGVRLFPSVTFISYLHGPWCPVLGGVIESLEEAGGLEKIHADSPYPEDKFASRGELARLPAAVETQLVKVAREWSGKTARDLKDFIYKLFVYAVTPFGYAIDFETIAPEDAFAPSISGSPADPEELRKMRGTFEKYLRALK